MSVVVGFLETPEGHAAVQRGVAEAKLRNLPLVLVHSAEGGAGADERELIAARDALERITARLRADGVDVEMRELVRGNTPAADLIDVAHQRNAELIVIGLRRRSAVGKLLLGSNAQQILMHADCPVLAVRAGPVTDG